MTTLIVIEYLVKACWVRTLVRDVLSKTPVPCLDDSFVLGLAVPHTSLPYVVPTLTRTHHVGVPYPQTGLPPTYGFIYVDKWCVLLCLYCCCCRFHLILLLSPVSVAFDIVESSTWSEVHKLIHMVVFSCIHTVCVGGTVNHQANGTITRHLQYPNRRSSEKTDYLPPLWVVCAWVCTDSRTWSYQQGYPHHTHTCSPSVVQHQLPYPV